MIVSIFPDFPAWGQSQSNSFSAEHIADKSKAELSQTFVLFAPEHSNHISSTVLDDKRPIVRTLKEAD